MIYEDNRKETVLLEIHKILLCAAECGPVEKKDSWEIKGIKEIIHLWHKREAELKKAKEEIRQQRKRIVVYEDYNPNIAYDCADNC